LEDFKEAASRGGPVKMVKKATRKEKNSTRDQKKKLKGSKRK